MHSASINLAKCSCLDGSAGSGCKASFTFASYKTLCFEGVAGESERDRVEMSAHDANGLLHMTTNA